MTVVLCWDIDGTLLTTARAGIFAWEDAIREVAGRACDFSSLETAGLTDVQIATRILERFGFEPEPPRVSALVGCYEARLADCLYRKTGRVLPGVRTILEHLRDRQEVVSILLTGNTEAGARAKLRHYGLEGYFHRGAFADGVADRVGIARLARAMARDIIGGEPDSSSMYVVGDTPHDVTCAQAIGARAIAVASGIYSVTDLAAYDPWWVLPELPSPDIFLARVTAERSDR
jgi:phosphoglycolate phosphatase-like HAD superfamily hydrolase